MAVAAYVRVAAASGHALSRELSAVPAVAPGAASTAAAMAAKVPRTAASAIGKLRVLCIHGFVQNASIFRSKTGSVRKAMKGCDFEFLEASLSAAGAFPDGEAADYDATGLAGEDDAGPRGWWTAGENASWVPGQPWVRPAMATVCAGWAETLADGRREVADRGPFDGILAFSQGCAIAAALLREAGEGALPALAAARFAVLVGGFLPRDPAVVAQLRGSGLPLQLHTLHVTGTQDTLVPRSRSEELSELFAKARCSWLEHGGRHGVPTGTGGFRDALRKLLEDAA